MTYFIVLPPFRLWRCGRAVSSLFFLGIVLSPGMAAAQVANPTKLAPSAQPLTSGGVNVTAPAAEELQAPANADKMFLTVRGVEVDDGFPELQEQTAALIGEIQGRRISVAKLYEFAQALELAYVNAGYPLARVTLPRQNVQSGSIRIVVIDGVLEDMDLSAVPERARDLIRARLQPLIGKKHLTTAEFQRRVLLTGDIAGITASSQIKAAPANRWILVITATEKLVSTATAASNRLPKELGTWEFSQAANVNNGLGWGEQFYASTRSASDFDRFFDGTSKFMAYGGGVIVPIGSDGLRAEASYAAVRQRPTHPFGVFPFEEEIEGERTAARFERATLTAIYPIILTVEQSLRVQATYDYTVNFQSEGPSPILGSLIFPLWPAYYGVSSDRYDAVRAAADWSVQFPWSWGGSATTTAIYSHGLGGRTAWDSPLVGTPLSRPGAGPNFDKIFINATISQPLPEGFQVLFIARAMTSFGAPLMLTEELSLDGANALSGFAAGTLNVDRGVTARSELSYPYTIDPEIIETLNTAAPGIIQNAVAVPYVFGAWGTGVHEWPFYNPFYVAEVKTIGAESLGGGLRADAHFLEAPFSESLALEFAKDFSNIPFKSSGYRTNFTFAVRF